MSSSPTVPANLDAIYAFMGSLLCITMFCSCVWLKARIYRQLGIGRFERLGRDITVKPKLWELELSPSSDRAEWKDLMPISIAEEAELEIARVPQKQRLLRLGTSPPRALPVQLQVAVMIVMPEADTTALEYNLGIGRTTVLVTEGSQFMG